MLSGNGIETSLVFQNKSNQLFPYEIGWHPSYVRQGNLEQDVIIFGDKETKLKDIRNGELSAVLFEGEDLGVYCNKDSGKGFVIQSMGFNDRWVVWMPKGQSQMFCFEAVSHFPSANKTKLIKDTNLSLAPEELREHTVRIYPFDFNDNEMFKNIVSKFNLKFN